MSALAIHYKVLIVDDNADCADMLAETLKLVGHDARVAYSGPAALELQQTFRPDAAVLDIELPDMNGCELAVRMLRASASRLWLIALTGYSSSEIRKLTRDAGFHAHLTKPIGVGMLAGCLERLAVLGESRQLH